MGSDLFLEQQNLAPLKLASIDRRLTALRDLWNDSYINLSAKAPEVAAAYRQCALDLKAIQESGRT